MKKTILFIFIALTTTANCQTVSRQLAETVAVNHFRNQFTDSVSLLTITPCFKDSTLCFYHVTMSNGAWCLVPSTMLVEPILMYGTSPYDTTNLAPAFLELIEWYKTQIDTIIKRSDAIRLIPQSWNQIFNPNKNIPQYYAGLLDESRSNVQRWKQEKNNDGNCTTSYNQECPEINDVTHTCIIPNGFLGLDTCNCGRKPTGCAAVAMGQVMWYWQWPRESEYRQYHWESMPPEIRDTTAPWKAGNIANLLRDCGRATDMHYCCFGSWALADDIVDAFNNAFKYNSVHKYYKEDWSFGTSWNDLIKSEIDNRRPVIMYGDNIAWTDGHFFVIDGYSYEYGETLYHINWGHGQNNETINNNYDHNYNYCLLDLLYEVTDNNTSTFCHHNRAIIGISPYYSDNNILDLTYIYVPQNNRRSEYAYNRVVVPETGSSLTVEADAHYTIEAGNEVVLQPGFFAREGSEVDVHIDQTWQNHKEILLTDYSYDAIIGQNYCIETKSADSWEFLVYTFSGVGVLQTAGSITSEVTCIWDGEHLQNGQYRCTLVLKNSYGRMYSTNYLLNVSIGRTGVNTSDYSELPNNTQMTNTNISLERGMVDLYPNPTNGELSMSVEEDVKSIVIYNLMGQSVGDWYLISMDGGKLTLNVSPLYVGTYHITVHTTNGATLLGRFMKM